MPLLNGCSIECPMTVSPICAIDSKEEKRTFNNECNFKASNCNDDEQGI